MANIKERITAILSDMKQGTIERDEALALSLLSALAGESIFLLGLPGVGKSMIARRLKLAFDNATVFEYLMSRFSTPDEILGPVSISKLKNADCYERMTEGYLPEADVVFLDEIWKAGPAIQNSLLTVLNEKIYLNGNHEIHLPLKGVIAASNELPAQDEGLEALWDRFLIRYVVNPIMDKQNFLRLLSSEENSDEASVSEPLNAEEYTRVRTECKRVNIPDKILEIIHSLRENLNERVNAKDVVTDEPDPANLKYYVSDRRWKKAVGIMKMSAYLNGRNNVDVSDLMLLNHILWNDESCIPVVRQTISETIVTSLFRDILNQYKSFKRHANVKRDEVRLYSPDRKHYIIKCDDSPLKITISDYKRMKASPDEVFFGSETSGGTILFRSRGQFVMRFVKDGIICINNYNYCLRTENDNQLNMDFIAEAGCSVESIANSLFLEMNHNIFIDNPEIIKSLKEVIAIYRARMDTM